MFKPRSTATDATPASIEVIRARARQRLIGTAVLVTVGVVGFPLVFDTEPRPVSADVPIDIPSRPATAPPVAVTPTPRGAVVPPESLGSKEEVVSNTPPMTEPAVASAAAPAAGAPSTASPEAVVAAQATEQADAAPQPAIAAASSAATDKLPTTNTRIVVQVGAFADAAKAREARLKLERAGLPSYTNVAKTPEGERIRVRIGPFKTKAEADKAAARAKALGLDAGLYWL